MDNFLSALSLASDDLTDAKAKLIFESVSLDQLLTVVTDEDLEEIGISESARLAIRIGVEKQRALNQVLPSPTFTFSILFPLRNIHFPYYPFPLFLITF